MFSKLFKKLSALPGVNWYNHKEKIEYELPVGRINPKLHHDNIDLLYKLSMTYFEKIVVQDKLIYLLKQLIDEFDTEVAKWDAIQAEHEKEIENVRRLEDQLKKAQLTRNPKIAITSRDIDKVIKHLDLISQRVVYNKTKEAKKYREMTQTLHNFLQKLKAHAASNDAV